MIEIQHHPGENEHSPDLYDALDQRLRGSHFDGSAAQAHGIACGLVCRDVSSTELEAIIQHFNFTDDASINALESLIEMSTRDLNQADFAFDLWLPEDDTLSIQLDALADWSQGYIIGLMHDGMQIRDQLSTELNESIPDIIDIAALGGTDIDVIDGEADIFQLREYLRMVVQVIYEELNPDRPITPVPD